MNYYDGIRVMTSKIEKYFDCWVCNHSFWRWVRNKGVCQTACPKCGNLACSDN